MKGKKFEDFITRLFDYYEIKYEQGAVLDKTKKADFKLSNGYYVDVKYNLYWAPTASIIYADDYDKDRVILITCTREFTRNLKYDLTRFENFCVIGLENLLWLCRNNLALREELTSFVDFSTEGLDAELTEKQKSMLGVKTQDIKSDNLTFERKLAQIQPGQEDSEKFEKFCEQFIKSIFVDVLEVTQSQVFNNKALFRFDIVSTIKDEAKSFWKFIYEKFNTKFILFECKNYKEPITQKELYLTERYLYDKALRNVAIIFTRNGADKNALIAAQGILREHGKLLLVLDNSDIITMEELHSKVILNSNRDEKNETISDYLFNKAKKFLMSLDK